MKKISLQGVATLCIIIVLGVLSYQIKHLDDTLTALARPSRLFNPSTIISRFANRPEWNVNVSPDHDRFCYVLTQQQLNWLGRGAQAFAFETQDGKFVFKFFNVSRIRNQEDRGFWRELFAKESREKRKQRMHHQEEIFYSSKMCFEELADETGIIYVHLNRTHEKIKGVKLVDRFGQSHRIRGDDACFVVQKKAQYLIPTLSNLMESGNFEGAKARINQITNLLLSVAQKGFTDGDDALIRNNNIGFTDNAAIYIDAGHITRCKNINVKERMKYEFQVRLKPLENWINVMYPELGAYYKQHAEDVMRKLEEKELQEAV